MALVAAAAVAMFVAVVASAAVGGTGSSDLTGKRSHLLVTDPADTRSAEERIHIAAAVAAADPEIQ